MKNFKKFLFIYSKILLLIFVALIGLLVVNLATFCETSENIFLAIGTGIFSSSFCMLVYEILNVIQNLNTIINELTDISLAVNCYYHLTTQFSSCIKSFISSKADMIVIKNLASTESFRIQLSGILIFNEIEKFNKHYNAFLSDNMLNLLNSISIEIQNNLDFISAISSSATGEFNSDLILSLELQKYMNDLHTNIQNKNRVFYEKAVK